MAARQLGDGTKALRDYAARVGIPVAGLRFVDGSGLARANRLTPPARDAARQGPAHVVVADLPRRATGRGHRPRPMDGGTLAGRMRGTAAAGNLRAKNGSLTGVTSLAGYVTGADGRRYVFVMISNYSGISPRPGGGSSGRAARAVAHDQPLTRGTRCVDRVVA